MIDRLERQIKKAKANIIKWQAVVDAYYDSWKTPEKLKIIKAREDRHKLAISLREEHLLKYKDIGLRLGVTASRALEIYNKAKRNESRRIN